MDAHAFTPNRPDDVVCVAVRRRPEGLGDTELCGYPPGHPIHATLLRKSLTEKYGPGEPATTPAEARTGISDRTAAALAAVSELDRTLRASGVDPMWFESRLRLIEQVLLGER